MIGIEGSGAEERGEGGACCSSLSGCALVVMRADDCMLFSSFGRWLFGGGLYVLKACPGKVYLVLALFPLLT